MFSWSSFLAVLGAVGSAISIWEFIKQRQSPPRRVAMLFIFVFVTMFVISIAFSNIFAPSSQAPSANPASSLPQAPPAPTDNTQKETALPPTPTPIPTPVQPGSGTQLFPTSGAVWYNGWSGGNDWYSSNGMLVNNGQQVNSLSLAPYNPGNNNVSDYAVDVDIQYKFSDAGAFAGSDSFGIIARSPDGQTGYKFAVCGSANTLARCGTNDYEINISNGGQNIVENPYRPHANEWHHYRMEVKGNTLTVLIDGTKYLQTTDTTYHLGGEVGLWSDRSQLTIRSFTITAL